jgi:ribosomal protein S18 acetylase RimI-like enzyme
MAGMDTPLYRMRRDLHRPLAPFHWPDRVRPLVFSPAHAAEVHALLELAYAKGGGTVAPFAQWWPALSADSEFDPALCFLAQTDGGAIIGVAQCWTSGFVKDLAVHPDWRMRGVGAALLLQAFQALRDRGAASADLKVEQDNPSGAVRFYERLGMTVVPD